MASCWDPTTARFGRWRCWTRPASRRHRRLTGLWLRSIRRSPPGPRRTNAGSSWPASEMQGPPQDWRAYVLCDASFRATPGGWATKAVNLYRKWQADRIVAEVNQGGEMVKQTIQTTDPLAAFRGVHATRGKVARAEPVAALYEQGRVYHVGAFPDLEDQMCAMHVGGYAETGSPDRVDALVWALTDLMIEPASKHSVPTISSL